MPERAALWSSLRWRTTCSTPWRPLSAANRFSIRPSFHKFLLRAPADAKTILEREAALEQALRESEERYRALALATDQIVWRVRRGRKQRLDFRELAAAWGMGKRSSKRPRLARFRAPRRSCCAWRKAGRRPCETGREYHTEFRMRVRDGSYRYFEARGVPVRNPDGTVREWIGANVDITERKRVEQELRASEHRRLMALSAARVGGFVWDPQSGESELTPELQEIFGFEAGPAEGRNQERWLARVHADDRAMVLERMQESESSGSMDFEYRYHHPQSRPALALR